VRTLSLFSQTTYPLQWPQDLRQLAAPVQDAGEGALDAEAARENRAAARRAAQWEAQRWRKAGAADRGMAQMSIEEHRAAAEVQPTPVVCVLLAVAVSVGAQCH
jgi:hypothetical protein